MVTTSINFVEARYGERVDTNKLKLLYALPTYHRARYHGMFRIQAGEVLAQIPENLRETATAFEVLFGQDLTECVDYPSLYGHKTITLLYGVAD